MVPTRLVLSAWNFIRNVLGSKPASASTLSDTGSLPAPIELLLSQEQDGDDYRWAGPTSTCLCGSELWHAVVWFDPVEREVSGRFIEVACVNCGSICKSPTPVD